MNEQQENENYENPEMQLVWNTTKGCFEWMEVDDFDDYDDNN